MVLAPSVLPVPPFLMGSGSLMIKNEGFRVPVPCVKGSLQNFRTGSGSVSTSIIGFRFPNRQNTGSWDGILVLGWLSLSHTGTT